MPKLEPKAVQKELEQNQLWPVYWLYGQERMKSRELLKRIRKVALGDEGDGAATAMNLLNEQTLEGAEVEAAQVLDSAMSCTLGGGLRFLIVRDAHLISGADELAPLLGDRAPREKLEHVCVFLSKDLDGRKKFSKLLTEKAAVVPCEDVPEAEREPWIGYLAKRREVLLSPAAVAQLAALDPWTLDIVDQELEKLALIRQTSPVNQIDDDVLSGDVTPVARADGFIDALLSRELPKALDTLAAFANQPDEALPLLGLLAWNVRHLAIVKAPDGGRSAKLNPYVAQRLQNWVKRWRLDEVIELQAAVARLDFEMKQTPLLPIGSWTNLVTAFCK